MVQSVMNTCHEQCCTGTAVLWVLGGAGAVGWWGAQRGAPGDNFGDWEAVWKWRLHICYLVPQRPHGTNPLR